LLYISATKLSDQTPIIDHESCSGIGIPDFENGRFPNEAAVKKFEFRSATQIAFPEAIKLMMSKFKPKSLKYILLLIS